MPLGILLGRRPRRAARRRSRPSLIMIMITILILSIIIITQLIITIHIVIIRIITIIIITMIMIMIIIMWRAGCPRRGCRLAPAALRAGGGGGSHPPWRRGVQSDLSRSRRGAPELFCSPGCAATPHAVGNPRGTPQGGAHV